MKRWIAVCVVGLSLVPCCGAQASGSADAAKEAKVQKLFTVMHMDRMMDQMMTAVKGMIGQMANGTPGMDKLTPSQKKIFDDFQDKAMKLAIDSMGWKALEPEYVKMYSTTFTSEEIDSITVFYQSPAGQAFLEKTPQLTTAGMKIVQARMVELQPKMKELQDEFVKEMDASSTPAGKPTSPPKY